MLKHILTLLAFIIVINSNLIASELRVFFVDVEGGAATLIVTPAGESLLIDCGNPGQRDAERIHKVATEKAGI